MAVLEEDIFKKIIEVGKKAIHALKEDNLSDFFELSEMAWNLFPNPKKNWNQAYNFSKMIYKLSLNKSEFNLAKKWLNRMIENNNNLHLSDIDIDFEIGKYYFETEDYPQAIEKWQYVEKEAGLRYFEGEKPEYLEFYKNPEKYLKK